MMRKIIFCCLLAVFTISCANDNFLDGRKNDLDGRTFFVFPGDIVRFIGDSVYSYQAPYLANDSYRLELMGHWVGDTIHFFGGHTVDFGKSWYIDSNYYVHSLPNLGYEMGLKDGRPMIELFEKPEYPETRDTWEHYDLSNQAWVMYKVKKPYTGHPYDKEQFYMNKSRKDFTKTAYHYLYVKKDSIIPHPDDKGSGFFRDFIGGGAVIYSRPYFEDWLYFGLDFASNRSYGGRILKIEDEGQFIVGLWDREQNRYKRIPASEYWIEPLTLDNVLPFLPKDL